MNYYPIKPPITPIRMAAVLLGLALGQSVAPAQNPTSGTIEGRVLNEAAGEYLNNARVTIEGTNLETFTDSLGQYRFTAAPIGPGKVHVFYTGLVSQTQSVAVEPGQVAQLDFTLNPMGRAPAGPVVKLDEFIVTAARETDATAIAINEQRFAPNIKTVTSAEEFGTNPSGNVGEFLKYVPGLTIDYNGGDPRYIILNGVPPQYVPVTVNGFGLAQAASGTTARQVELEQVSLNNIARVEVVGSPTPESPGNALAGSVNLVPRTAFEYSKPVFKYNAFIMAADDAIDAWHPLHKSPGALRDPDRKAYPGGNFSYVLPLTKKFGITLAGATTSQGRNDFIDTLTWVGTLNAPPLVNGAPLTDSSNPYLQNVVIGDQPGLTRRASWSATLDFKPTRDDVFSLGMQWATIHIFGNSHSFQFAPGTPTSFSPYFTHGTTNAGILTNSSGTINKSGTTWMPTLTWRHNGRVWRAEAGVGYSHATNHYREPNDAVSVSLRRAGDITINYDDNFYLRPGTITVTSAGRPIDPYNLGTYSMQSVSALYREASDLKRSVYGNLARDLDVGVPLTLKTGFDVSQQQRDIEDVGRTWTYKGPDGRTSQTPVGNDDSVPFLLDSVFSKRFAPYGFPQVQYASQWLAGDVLRTHPEWFNAPTDVSQYNTAAANSKYIQESIYAAYLRGDAQFLERRLKLVGGMRAEQTNVRGESQLTDNTANFRRDTNGRPVLDAAGRNALINPAGSLEEAKLLHRRRANIVRREYLRLFPSINASYNLSENLVARGAYYWSLGRPDLGQYSSGITLPNLDAAPSSSNRFSINNPNIKPWSARTAKLTLEYYMKQVGFFSVEVFRRDFKNFFVGTIDAATPAFLDAVGLPDSYSGYDVSTQRNSPYPVMISGISFNYRQALTFLPHWARGVTVSASESSQRIRGVEASNIISSAFVPWTTNARIRLDRERFSVMVNGNYRARLDHGVVAATGAKVYYNRRIYLDTEATYYLDKMRKVGLFVNGINLRDQAENNNEVAGPNTPPVAQHRDRRLYGVLWTFGVKGTF